jgi:hypothetical protein
VSLGVGAITRDGHALLLVDSMSLEVVRGRFVTPRPDSRKAVPLPMIGASAFVSAPADYLSIVPQGFRRGHDFDAVARSLHADLLRVHVAAVGLMAELADAEPHLLVVSRTRLACLTPSGDSITREPGWAFAGGWVADFVRPRGIAPQPAATVDEARAVALGLARDCVAEARARGGVATIGAPFYVTTFADRITEERFES